MKNLRDDLLKIYADNNRAIYDRCDRLADCLAKKIKKGIKLDAEKLENSELIRSIVSDCVKCVKKYDDAEVTRQGRKNAAKEIAASILEDAGYRAKDN